MTDRENPEEDTASGGAPEPDNGDVASTHATGTHATDTPATATEESDGTPVENPSGG